MYKKKPEQDLVKLFIFSRFWSGNVIVPSFRQKNWTELSNAHYRAGQLHWLVVVVVVVMWCDSMLVAWMTTVNGNGHDVRQNDNRIGNVDANVNLSTFNYLMVFGVVIKTLFAVGTVVCILNVAVVVVAFRLLPVWWRLLALFVCLCSSYHDHCAIIVKCDTLRKEENNGITRSSLVMVFSGFVLLLFPLDWGQRLGFFCLFFGMKLFSFLSTWFFAFDASICGHIITLSIICAKNRDMSHWMANLRHPTYIYRTNILESLDEICFRFFWQVAARNNSLRKYPIRIIFGK